MRSISAIFIACMMAVGLTPAAATAQEPQRPAAPPLPAGVKLIPNLEYASPGGHSLLLDLYLPTSIDKPVPVIMFVHGGAWLGGDRHDRTAVPMAAQGYAVASIEYRLSPVAPFPAQIEDCKAAIRWLRAHAKAYSLDTTHLGVWGSSAGGHLVALLGTTGDVKELEGDEGNLDYSSRVQAVCDWFGPTDFQSISAQAAQLPFPSAIKHEAPDSPEARLIGGAVADNPEKARAASPITYISKNDPPFLIMHGDRDPLVPLAQSEEFRDALHKAGVPVSLEVIQGAGHGFGGPKVMARVQAFFDEHLKPALSTQPAPDPAGSAPTK